MGKGNQEEKQNTEVVSEEAKNLLRHPISQHEEEGPPPPPDGGWGWVIVAASFLCNMVLDGIGYSFGILLAPLMVHYGEGKGTIAMVGSILTGAIMLVGPLASALVNKYGPRKTCIAGALVSSLSIFLSTFSPNVYLLMLSYGVLGGLGLGLMYVPAVTAVGYWFEKKRSLVTGISTCGSGFGTIVFAPVVTALEAGLGWQWCNRIVACFCLACSLLGATMKPVPRKTKDEEDSITEMKKQNENPIIKNGAYVAKEEIDFMDGTAPASLEADDSNLVKTETETVVLPKENGYLTVLKNVPFLMIMLGNLPAVMGLYIPYMFLPGITQQRGMSEGDSALLISLIGFFNTGGRIVSGAVTDHPRVDALFVTTLALFFGAICPALMTLCYDFWSYSIVCILFGVSLSAWPAVTSSMLVDILGLELLTSAFGVLTCIRGLSAFLGPPLGGFVIDATSPEKIVQVTDVIAANVTSLATEAISTLSEISTEASKPEDTSNYQVAFVISACLLGLASAIHLVAFFVKKAYAAKKTESETPKA
eukprot:GFUD01106387.1.p1 GENE.GFUD01106387.1~~GFUD01106387.1.p1  ORF type:complete len:535 (+),score=130.06 GFUD01106387.1:51-1655(+)